MLNACARAALEWVRAFLNAGSISGQAIAFISGKIGDRLVILVGGGSKKRQSKDIAAEQERRANYKLRKKEETD